MRLFIAIPLPKAVKERLAGLQQPLDGLRWLPKEQYHLTLKFLGETDRRQSQKLRDRLSTISQSPLLLNIKGLGTFPQVGQPRVLWANVLKNGQLSNFQQHIEQLCISLGYDSANHSFNPHITLARMSQESALESKVDTLKERHSAFTISETPVNNFVLYQSKHHTEGVKYERIETFSL